MTDRIRLLPEIVANQIAAGEVVNHPSSVVKEMMENAIDAGASTVKVNVSEGGRDLIQIVDDGCGMSPIDARMAFDRHATSKITSVDDIYALHTFGFRGEALASIASVSQVELRTRQQGDEIGTQTEVNGGIFAAQKPVMCPVGSQFFVRNLFYNTPARRRFMDNATSAFKLIKSEFSRVALCYPQVRFELYDNDTPIYTLPPAPLAGRIVDVIGRYIKQNLLELSANTSIARLEGYIGQPAAAKKNNSEQYLFVNGRYFKSPYLYKAILKGYEKLIPESCKPSFFLYLNIDPARIDVNVHPQKIEVKFADEQAIWQIVLAAVRETLGKTGAVPLMDFDMRSAVEIPVMRHGAIYQEPQTITDRSYNPFREEYIDPSAPAPDVEFTGFDVPYDDAAHHSTTMSNSPRCRFEANRGLVENSYFAIESEGVMTGVDKQRHFQESELEFIPSATVQDVQQCLIDEPAPDFEHVIPLGGGYAAALYGGRLVVVDLRRARERICYEGYLLMLGNGSSVSQQLLFPEELVLSGDEYALLEENAVDFAALGFEIDYLGQGTIQVKGTPADMPTDAVDELIFELLQTFLLPLDREALRREKIAAVMAREGSKSLPRMDAQQATQLLEQLCQCADRSYSPTGKAIMAQITSEEIRAKLA